jgi:hypothetical protein
MLSVSTNQSDAKSKTSLEAGDVSASDPIGSRINAQHVAPNRCILKAREYNSANP